MTDSQKLDLLVTAVTGIHHEMGGMKQQMNGLQQQMNGLQQQMNSLQNQVNGLQDQVIGLQDQVNGLENRMDGMQQQINDLQDEMRTEFANVRSEMQTLHDKLDFKIDTVRKELHDEILLNRQAVCELNEHVKRLDKNGLDIQQLKEAHEQFRRRFAHLYKQHPPYTE